MLPSTSSSASSAQPSCGRFCDRGVGEPAHGVSNVQCDGGSHDCQITTDCQTLVGFNLTARHLWGSTGVEPHLRQALKAWYLAAQAPPLTPAFVPRVTVTLSALRMLCRLLNKQQEHCGCSDYFVTGSFMHLRHVWAGMSVTVLEVHGLCKHRHRPLRR